MCSETGTKFCCTCCCSSNTAAAKRLANMYLVILGITELVLFIKLNNHNQQLSKKTILFWAFLITVTFWFLLSILVVNGTNGKHKRLLLVSAVLGMLGEFGFAAFFFIYYRDYGYLSHWSSVRWEITFGCVHLFVSFWYVLCIFGAMLEAKNGENNTSGIVHGTSGVEMGQSLPMQQQTGYITVPSNHTEPQQIYPHPGSLEVEMGQPIHMQSKYDVEPSAPPSYHELFPPMSQLSK